MAALPHVYTTATTASAASALADKRPARVCQQCGTASTAQWRYGHNGSFLMCNACGIRWRRKNHTQEKRRRPGPRPPTSSAHRFASPAHSSPIQKHRYQHYTPRYYASHGSPSTARFSPFCGLSSLVSPTPRYAPVHTPAPSGRHRLALDTLLSRVPSFPAVSAVPPLSTSPVSSQSAYPIVPVPKMPSSTSSPLSIRNLLNDDAPATSTAPPAPVPYYSPMAMEPAARNNSANYAADAHYYC